MSQKKNIHIEYSYKKGVNEYEYFMVACITVLL